MKLKIFFIIFINLLSNSNVVLIDILYTPIGKNGSKVFDSNDGIILFLDLSNFQINDDIFYYFEFNETDALDDNEESLITFYESYIYEINQEEEFIISKYIDSSYIKTYQTISSKTKFYFSSSKKNESNYLLIGLSSELTIQNQFKFKNTKKDESIENTELTILWNILFFVIILLSIILAMILRAYKKKKENETDNTQNEYNQEGQNEHQNESSQKGDKVQQNEFSHEGQNVQQNEYGNEKYIQQTQYRKEDLISQQNEYIQDGQNVQQTERINPVQIYSQENFNEMNI